MLPAERKAGIRGIHNAHIRGRQCGKRPRRHRSWIDLAVFGPTNQRCANLLPLHRARPALSAALREQRAFRKIPGWCPEHATGGGISVPSSQTAAMIAAHAQHRTLVCGLFPLGVALMCVHGRPLCSGRFTTAVRAHCPNGRAHCKPSTAGVCDQLAVGRDRSLRCAPATRASWGH